VEPVDEPGGVVDAPPLRRFKQSHSIRPFHEVPEAMAVNSSPANFAKDQLRSIVERIERLEEEKAALSEDIKEVYAEAKGNGFDTKVLRTVVRLRKQDSNERAEQEAVLDLYMHALGMAVTETAEAAE
jgi:uncharacterized protein (UPF0335 family)